MEGIYSYHVVKVYPLHPYIFYWPPEGEYCIDKTEALREYNNLTKGIPRDHYRIIRYQAVRFDDRVIGITGDPDVVEDNQTIYL